MAEKLPNCFKCVHHFITYTKNRPYGCRAMRFKSKVMPSRVVYESSGMRCQLFEPKSGGPDKSDKSNKNKWTA